METAGQSSVGWPPEGDERVLEDPPGGRHGPSGGGKLPIYYYQEGARNQDEVARKRQSKAKDDAAEGNNKM